MFLVFLWLLLGLVRKIIQLEVVEKRFLVATDAIQWGWESIGDRVWTALKVLSALYVLSNTKLQAPAFNFLSVSLNGVGNHKKNYLGSSITHKNL